jgi:hypothetical protein
MTRPSDGDSITLQGVELLCIHNWQMTQAITISNIGARRRTGWLISIRSSAPFQVRAECDTNNIYQHNNETLKDVKSP